MPLEEHTGRRVRSRNAQRYSASKRAASAKLRGVTSYRGFSFSELSMKVKPKRPFTHKFPAVTLESLGEVTRTIVLSCTRSESVQPTPQ